MLSMTTIEPVSPKTHADFPKGRFCLFSPQYVQNFTYISPVYAFRFYKLGLC